MQALRIAETMEGDTHVLTVVGRLDASTSPQLDAAVSRIYGREKTADVVLEMGRCTYVSSAGLRVFAALHKRSMAGGSLKLRHVLPDVMNSLVSASFDSILQFE